jgi:hypothetical protein
MIDFAVVPVTTLTSDFRKAEGVFAVYSPIIVVLRLGVEALKRQCPVIQP